MALAEVWEPGDSLERLAAASVARRREEEHQGETLASLRSSRFLAMMHVEELGRGWATYEKPGSSPISAVQSAHLVQAMAPIAGQPEQ